MTPTGTIGSHIVSLESVDSTNRYARTLAGEGAPQGTVITAEEQLAGKGRMGRAWISPRGKNLTFSVILRPSIPMDKMGIIPIMAAVAVIEALEANGIVAEAKWPNDLLMNGKKVCGILGEIVTAGAGAPVVIIGIGLNVNQVKFPPDLENHATSLTLQAQRTFNRSGLLQGILQSLDRWYGVLQSSDFGRILLRWKQSCGMLGTEIALTSGGSVIHGTALDIADDGALLLHSGGRVEKVYAGDVSVLK